MVTRLTVKNKPSAITSYCSRCKKAKPIDQFDVGTKRVNEFFIRSTCKYCVNSRKKFRKICVQCGDYFTTANNRIINCSKSCSNISAPSGIKNSEEFKWCPQCRESQPTDNFQKKSGARGGWCQKCCAIKKRKYTLERFNLTEESFLQVFRRQDGCKICHVTETDGSPKFWHLDHDHRCCNLGCPKCFRGILCHSCNHLLGKCREDPKILEGALDYLRDWFSENPDLGGVAL